MAIALVITFKKLLLFNVHIFIYVYALYMLWTAYVSIFMTGCQFLRIFLRFSVEVLKKKQQKLHVQTNAVGTW